MVNYELIRRAGLEIRIRSRPLSVFVRIERVSVLVSGSQLFFGLDIHTAPNVVVKLLVNLLRVALQVWSGEPCLILVQVRLRIRVHRFELRNRILIYEVSLILRRKTSNQRVNDVVFVQVLVVHYFLDQVLSALFVSVLHALQGVNP